MKFLLTSRLETWILMTKKQSFVFNEQILWKHGGLLDEIDNKEIAQQFPRDRSLIAMRKFALAHVGSVRREGKNAITISICARCNFCFFCLVYLTPRAKFNQTSWQCQLRDLFILETNLLLTAYHSCDINRFCMGVDNRKVEAYLVPRSYRATVT